MAEYTNRVRVMAGVKSGLIILALYFQQIISFSNVFSYIFLIFLAGVMIKNANPSNRWINITSIILSVCCTAGNLTAWDNFRNYLTVWYGQDMVWFFRLVSFAYVTVGVSGWYFLWQYSLWQIMHVLRRIKADKLSDAKGTQWYVFLPAVGLSGVLCYLPYFLCYFPGIVTADSIWQLRQATDQVPRTNHHPWLHTLMIKAAYQMGGGNNGVAIYSACSMLMMAFAFACVLFILYQNGIRIRYLAGLYLFFYLTPFNGMYSISMWKDVPFGLCMLVFTVFVWSKKRLAKWLVWDSAIFCLLGFLICTMRSNGKFIYILCIPFIILYLDKTRKQCTLMTLLTLVFVGLFNGIVLPLMHVENVDFVEALSIPVQQIAYVIVQEGDISENDLALLNRIVNVDDIPGQYCTYLSDPVKNLIRKGNQEYLVQHKMDYFVAWLRIGIKNPVYYIRAWISQTEGYWYHKLDYYWKYHQGIERVEELGISRTCLVPYSVKQFLEWWCSYFDRRIYTQFWSLGMTTWMVLILWAYAKIHHKCSFPYFLPLFNIVSLLIATPVSQEFRYVYGVFLLMPVLGVMTLCRREDTMEEENKLYIMSKVIKSGEEL